MRDKYKYLFNRVFFILSISIILNITFLIIIAIYELKSQSFIISVLGFLILIVLLLNLYMHIIKPYLITNKVLRLFVEGHHIQDIFKLKTPYSREMELSLKKINELLDTKKLISVSKKQAEYLALQNQINPHFLYNALEGIRSEALIEGMDDIAKMTEALATFFRYTISQMDNLVTLEDELQNVENYYIIQQYRFGDRLKLIVSYDETDEKEVLGYLLPKLTLQPIVENAIYHGIERKVGAGNVHIRISSSDKYFIISISDDGIGIKEDKLQELSKRLRSMSIDAVSPNAHRENGVATINVNNRIKLLFGEEYGLNIYSTYNLGTDVEILLPIIKNR